MTAIELYMEQETPNQEVNARQKRSGECRYEIVERAKKVVEENIACSGLTVDDVAKDVFLSASYLRGIFREMTGGTLHGFIVASRIGKICEFLEDTDMSARMIAEHMGFSSKSGLFNYFKKYMTITPNEYRQLRRSNPDGHKIRNHGSMETSFFDIVQNTLYEEGHYGDDYV